MEQYIPYIIAGGIALAVIAVLVLIWYLYQQNLKKRGIDGERKVARKLKRFAGIRSYKVINDLYLPLYDKTTQVDHVLIGFFGLIVVETKASGGEIYGDPKEKNWLHIMGKKRHTMYNPLMQNQAHVDCIRHLLGKEKIYNVNIESIVVFTNKKADLYIPKKLPILKLKALSKFLHQPRFSEDKDFDVDAAYNALMKYRITDPKKIAEHVDNVKEMAKNKK